MTINYLEKEFSMAQHEKFIRLNDLCFYGERAYYDFMIAEGMDSAEAIMASDKGTVVDKNTDKKVHRLNGPGGEVFFLKCFGEKRLTCKLKRVFQQKLASHGRIEVRNLHYLQSAGFETAELLFWAKTGGNIIDGDYSFVALKELEGYRELGQLSGSEWKRGWSSATSVFFRLLDKGIYWPDSHPKHFFIAFEGGDVKVSLIDLHGMRPQTRLTSYRLEKMVKRFFRLSSEVDREKAVMMLDGAVKDHTLKNSVMKLIKEPVVLTFRGGDRELV
jgi:hypothetical protein